ncbi:MAG TPA: MFS transporter, partial [Acidothermaceae bacterium]
GPRLGGDARWLCAGQALRASGYGFTAVLLGAFLATSGYSHLRAGVLLTAIIGGTALASLVIGAVADRVGRRASYATFFVGIAVAGAIFASGPPFWLMLVVASTGTLSTDVVDNGPATTLEQVMLADADGGSALVYGRYNAVGAVAGAVGALGATLPGVQRPGDAGLHVWLFAVLIPVGVAGALVATRLSPAVEISAGPEFEGRRLSLRLPPGPSRRVVHRLAALFAVDAAGGGLVTTGFLSYFFVQRYHASLADLGWMFFTVSLIQAISVRLAPVIARRFGLVATMVGTHLPSNVLLLAVAFAPSFPIAVGLLLARTTLSQMDVPTRQALVMTVVMPEERTVAAAVTNSARYAVRPAGPVIGGALQQLSLGAPLVVAGLVKAAYDVALWRWARHLPPVARGAVAVPDGAGGLPGGAASR